MKRWIRYRLCRQIPPQELEDKVHDTLLIVLQAIQRGELRDPGALLGFADTVAHRQIAAFIHGQVQRRATNSDSDVESLLDDSRDPEETAARRQRVGLMKATLRGLPARDCEVLLRVYVYEQTQAQICQDLELTDTQFRLLKSRAKAKAAELSRRKLRHRNLAYVRAIDDGRV